MRSSDHRRWAATIGRAALVIKSALMPAVVSRLGDVQAWMI